MKPNGGLNNELAELHRQMAKLAAGRRQIVRPATRKEAKALGLIVDPESPTIGQRIKALFR